MITESGANSRVGRIMLVGSDRNRILETRFKAAGYQVVTANDIKSAVDHARHESFDTAVLVSHGSLVNVAEMIFNLRDLNKSIEIIILVSGVKRHANRLFRQLVEHPIEGTRIVTRRQLQKQLHAFSQQSPPGAPLLEV